LRHTCDGSAKKRKRGTKREFVSEEVPLLNDSEINTTGAVKRIARRQWDSPEEFFCTQNCNQSRSARETFHRHTEERMLRLSHYKKLCHLLKKKNQSNALKRAIVEQRSFLPASPGKAGETYPYIGRGPVGTAFACLRVHYRVGIPLAKLDDCEYLDLIQGDGLSLGGRESVRKMQPMLQTVLDGEVQMAHKGRKVSLIMDGSKANKLVEALLSRFFDDNGDICQMCVGVAVVPRTLNGAQLKGIFASQMRKRSVVVQSVSCVISDSASVNKKAFLAQGALISQLKRGEKKNKNSPNDLKWRHYTSIDNHI